MDKKSLKSIVIGYKLSGLSYSNIAVELEKEYGIKMSRQAINGLYKRATSDKEVEKNIQTVLNTTDICYYSTLGYAIKEIKEIIQTDEFELSLGKIADIISGNEELINSIEKSLIDKIVSGLKNNLSSEDIKQTIKFKGTNVKNKKWDELLSKSSEAYINDAIVNSLSDLLKLTDDRDLVRSKMKKYSIDTPMKEIIQRNS